MNSKSATESPYFCLRISTTVKAVTPHLGAYGAIEVSMDKQEVSLWKCLLHSRPKVSEVPYFPGLR